MVMLIQRTARASTGNLGYASALSIVLFFVTVAPMLVLAAPQPEGGRRMSVWSTDPVAVRRTRPRTGRTWYIRPPRPAAGRGGFNSIVPGARSSSGTCC